MALTKDQFVDKMMDLHRKRKQLNDLAEQRKAEEEALALEFRVNECNTRRGAIIKKYQDLGTSVLQEAKALEAELMNP